MAASGFVLAGGRGARMGRDKTRVLLAGQPLVAHAVARLRRLCPVVFVLSNDPSLATFGPVIPDLHPGCGPLAGMEAALTHTHTEWNLFLPVDVPFIPHAFLQRLLDSATPPAKALVARAEGRLQPTVAVLHRDLLPSLSRSLALGDFKLRPALEQAAQEQAALEQAALEQVARALDPSTHTFQIVDAPTGIAFANLNTPEDLALAEAHAHLLDTSAGSGIR